MSDRTEAMHSLYLIARVIDGVLTGPVKVGISADPAQRVKTLQTGCPDQLVVAHVFKMPSRDWARRVEGGFKDIYAEKQVLGEWFDVAPADAIGRLGLGIFTAIVEGRDPFEDADEIEDLLNRSRVFAIDVRTLRARRREAK